MESDARVPNREKLVSAVLAFLHDQDLLARDDIRAALEHEIDEAGADAPAALEARLSADAAWTYHPPDSLARRIHHRLADRFIDPASSVLGTEHLSAVDGTRVVIVANHLSYADANIIDVLLERSGGSSLANRLTALAGPKVFSNLQRRFSSLCFGTIKVPQSAEVSSEDAVLQAREVARAARRAIDVAHERLDAGDTLLLFGEGTRSRTASLQRMLPGASRYLDAPGTWVLAIGLTGPEDMFPIDATSPRKARIVMQVGRPLDAGALLAAARSDRRLVMDVVGLAVANVLPPTYRGAYSQAGDLPDAWDIFQRLEQDVDSSR